MRDSLKQLCAGIALLILAFVMLLAAEAQGPLMGDLIWYGGWAAAAVGITFVIMALVKSIPNSRN